MLPCGRTDTQTHIEATVSFKYSQLIHSMFTIKHYTASGPHLLSPEHATCIVFTVRVRSAE